MSGDGKKRSALALVVGVGRYRLAPPIPRLRYAVADAEAVAEALKNPAICGFPEEGVTLLRDAEATREEVVRKLSKWLPEAARDAEIVVIYFAGHGRMLGPGNDSAFLMPYDADPDDLVTLGIEMGELRRWIGMIDARSIVLCLDCCHSGKIIARDVDAGRSAPRDVGIGPSALERLSTNDPSGKGVFVISACGEGQFAHEMVDLEHGLFTHHLLEGIKGGARDEDGTVGISKLFEYVSQGVRRDAERVFGVAQKPWYNVTGSGPVSLTIPGIRVDSSASLFDMPTMSADESEEDRVSEFERRYPSADEAGLIRGLRELKAMATPGRFPAIFRCLSHHSEEVRVRAKATVDAIGWDTMAEGIERLARKLDDERAGHVLDGLKAIKSERPVVALLDRLIERLRGSPRNTAILLVEQKRLALDMAAIADLFRERKSPYQIRKVLGQGLFAAAYLAHDDRSDMEVVVRILRREFVHQPMVRAHFLGLARQCIPLTHQNLVSTRDSGDFRDRDVFFAVRKHVEGVTLQEMFKGGRKFEPVEVVSLLRQAAGALVTLHEAEIVHGGIKPSNLFLSVKVKDRVIVGDPSLMMPGVVVSFDRLSYDYRYASPEQFQGNGQLTKQSDLYALGCIAYELLCDAPPHVGDNPYDLAMRHKHDEIEPPSGWARSLGPSGDDLIRRLLSRSPADRPSDADALIRELDAVRDTLRSSGKVPRPAPSPLGGALDRYQGVQSLVDLGPGIPGGAPRHEDVLKWDELHAPAESDATPSGPDRGPSPIADDLDDDFPADDTPLPSRGPTGPGDLPLADEPSWVSPETNWPGAQMSANQEWTIDPGGTIPKIPPPAPSEWPANSDGTLLPPFAAEAPIFEVGRVVFGKYSLLERLGRGGMGDVWLVKDVDLEIKRALKVINPGTAFDPETRARFRREARVMAQFSHRNVVMVHDSRLDLRGIAYIVMEYVPGQNLNDILRPGRPMPIDWVFRLLSQLCDALHDAHRLGIIHRDLKPSNLILMADETGEGEVLKVLDFGIAKILQAEEVSEEVQTLNGAFMGTPPYTSPEQADGHAEPLSDIYSVGVILFEALTGHRPFRGKSIEMIAMTLYKPAPSFAEVNPEVNIPPEIERVVLRCLAKDPADRPQSARALFEEFEAAMSVARSLPSPGPGSKEGRGRSIALALSIVLAAMAAIGYWLWNR